MLFYLIKEIRKKKTALRLRGFDSVNRIGLWLKMVNSGINGKLFQLVRAIYLDVKHEFSLRYLQT